MSKNTNKPLSDNPTMKAIAAYAEAKEQIARLTAENERLRKAGDAMAKLLSCAGSPPSEVADWLAAKERRDAK